MNGEWTVIRHSPDWPKDVPTVRMVKTADAVEAIEVFYPHASKIVPEPEKVYLGNRVWLVFFRGWMYYCIEPS